MVAFRVQDRETKQFVKSINLDNNEIEYCEDARKARTFDSEIWKKVWARLGNYTFYYLHKKYEVPVGEHDLTINVSGDNQVYFHSDTLGGFQFPQNMTADQLCTLGLALFNIGYSLDKEVKAGDIIQRLPPNASIPVRLLQDIIYVPEPPSEPRDNIYDGGSKEELADLTRDYMDMIHEATDMVEIGLLHNGTISEEAHKQCLLAIKEALTPREEREGFDD